LDTIREVAGRIGEVRQVQGFLDVKSPAWVPKAAMMDEVTFVQVQYSKLTSQVAWLLKQAPRDKAKLQELKLPPDTLDLEVRKAKFSCLGAAKYVMQMGLTANTRLEEAAVGGDIPAKTLAHNRNQARTICLCGLRNVCRYRT